MKKAITISMFAMLMALCVSAAAQQKDVRVYRDGNQWIEETKGTLPAARGLSLKSAVGSVVIAGGAQSNITYVIKKRVSRSAEDVSRRDMENFVITVSRRNDVAIIEADWPRQRSGKLDAEFYVMVPKEMMGVGVQTLGGSVEVKNIAGKAYTQTAGGSITMDDIGGNAEAHTMGGSIDVGKIGGDTKLETAGGSINTLSVNGGIAATTAGR